MSKHISIVDETLRDGHQCLWSTRMTNRMMLPFASRMDDAGFAAIDLIGGAVWDVSIRFLLEDPWERIRLVSSQLSRTPLNAWIRGQSLWTFEIFPDDIVELAIERLAANGIRRISLYDQMNDLQNVETCIRKGRSEGLNVSGALVFTLSPVHTDEYYAEKAREFLRMGVDEIIIKDPSGLLCKDRIRTIVPALKEVTGDAALLNLHSHCMSGRAPEVLLESVGLGVDRLHTAISPLAYAASHPPTEWIDERLREMGYTAGLDVTVLKEMADYFGYVADRWGKQRGEPVEFDPRLLEHQMPGGMISNLRSQLQTIALEHKLDEVLEETAQVRKDLGYAPMVSPTAQFMVTQAVLNVEQGERYKTIPDELRKYVLGYYGKPAGPLAQELVDRVVTDPKEIVTGPAGSLVEPAVKKLKQTHGPFRSDEDLLHHAFYSESVLKPLFAARERSNYGRCFGQYMPLDQLFLEIADNLKLRTIRISKPSARFDLACSH